MLLNKTTPTGKAVRTFLQALAGTLLFVLGFVTIPGVGEYLNDNNIVALPTLATCISVITYVHNALENYLADV